VLANGWDNVVFRVGGDLLARLPRREMGARLVGHEQRWLPVLAPRLPLPIPAPARTGRPGLGPRWAEPPVWVHGDLHPANILVQRGRISGVIDFGDLTAGDPAADLSVGWMLLPADCQTGVPGFGWGQRHQLGSGDRLGTGVGAGISGSLGGQPAAGRGGPRHAPRRARLGPRLRGHGRAEGGADRPRQTRWAHCPPS
jgi:aminoglycoside phosphotransferase (APT) family kinase protein